MSSLDLLFGISLSPYPSAVENNSPWVFVSVGHFFYLLKAEGIHLSSSLNIGISCYVNRTGFNIIK